MNKNIGNIERILRILIGAGLVAWVLAFNGPVWAWIGALPLATGLMGWCLPYQLLGINTCPMKK